MTTKPMFFDRGSASYADRHFYSVQFTWSLARILAINTWLVLSLGGFFPLFLPMPTLAESRPSISKRLPPPPPISGRNSNTRTRRYLLHQKTEIDPPTNIHSNRSREYTFSAPKTNLPSSNTNQIYKVEVFGSSDMVLEQVRNIEPKAFRQGSVIQAGIFQDQANAEELVRQLASQGLWSRIISQ